VILRSITIIVGVILGVKSSDSNGKLNHHQVRRTPTSHRFANHLAAITDRDVCILGRRDLGDWGPADGPIYPGLAFSTSRDRNGKDFESLDHAKSAMWNSVEPHFLSSILKVRMHCHQKQSLSFDIVIDRLRLVRDMIWSMNKFVHLRGSPESRHGHQEATDTNLESTSGLTRLERETGGFFPWVQGAYRTFPAYVDLPSILSKSILNCWPQICGQQFTRPGSGAHTIFVEGASSPHRKSILFYSNGVIGCTIVILR
jgi:hypothetical protein